MQSLPVVAQKFRQRGYLLLLLAFAVQGFFAVTKNSLTLDEPAYLLAGTFYVRTGDFFYNTVHPPTMKYAFSLPFLLFSEEGTAHRPWFALLREAKTANAKRHVLRNVLGGIYRRTPYLILAARLITLGLGLATLAGIFTWTRALFGVPAAYTSLAAAAFSPILLAHSSLATLDLPLTCFFFFAVYQLWLSFHGQHPRRSLIFSFLASALAITTKTPGWVLLPVLTVLFYLETRKRKPRSLAMRTTLGFAAAWLVFNTFALHASYGFSNPSIPVADFQEAFPNAPPPPATETAPRLRGPAPTVVLYGATRLAKQLDNGWLTHFFGRASAKGSWWLYPAAIVLKTPMAALALAALAVVVFFRVFSLARVTEAAFLLLPSATIFLVFCFFSDVVGGVRYILPALPFAFVLLGYCFRWPEPSTARRLEKIVCFLLVGNALASLGVCANYLSYVNEVTYLAPKQRYYFCGGDFDWGQNLLRLAKFVRENKIRPLALAPDDFALMEYSLDPRVYGIAYHWDRARPWHKGYLARSHCYEGQIARQAEKALPDAYPWEEHPIAEIDRSLSLFALGDDPLPPKAETSPDAVPESPANPGDTALSPR